MLYWIIIIFYIPGHVTLWCLEALLVVYASDVIPWKNNKVMCCRMAKDWAQNIELWIKEIEREVSTGDRGYNQGMKKKTTTVWCTVCGD